MNEFIPVNEPLLDGKERELLVRCIDTGWISSEGPFVREFEQKFAESVGRKYGVAVCNGSAALEVAVRALNIGEGDEVIMPTMTIISCASPVVRSGAMPVLIDSDACTWNMDVARLEDRITSSTRAIMVVHTYGLPVDMDPVLELADKYGLDILEDAAEAIGQKYKGRPCGSFGRLSIFSFYTNKHITTGEGGMIVTDDAALADRCRSLRNLCFQPGKRFVHNELGWNFRMTNLQAAVGLAQLQQLDVHLTRKHQIGNRYHELLADVDGLLLPLKRTEYAVNVYWVFGLVLDDQIPFDAEQVMSMLRERKIDTRPFFWPMHAQPVFRKLELFQETRCPVADRLARRGFYIPTGLALTDSQIERVAEGLRQVLS